jgi:hypothetical protein
MDFETAAHALVGRLVFAYSQLDVNIALYIANAAKCQEYEKCLRQLEHASFKDKLQQLSRIIEVLCMANVANTQDWKLWVLRANSLREQRNAMVHGRWGIAERQGFVANVVGFPGAKGAKEVRYSLVELEKAVLQAELVSTEFWNLSRRRQ